VPAPSSDRHAAEARGSFAGPRVAALVLIALGLVAMFDATRLRPVQGYAAVGPAVMPFVVGAGLIVIGLVLLVRTTIRSDLELARHVAKEAAQSEWRTPGLTLGALLVYALFLDPLGYVLSTALFLPVEARILGSGSSRRDVLVAVVLALVVYLAFTRFLGVRLPAGPLAGIL